VGGYSDWLHQRKSAVAEASAAAVSKRAAVMGPAGAANPPAAANPPVATLKARRLSYNEQRELAQLPGKIQHLEAEQAQLTTLISDPIVFQGKQDQGSQALQRLQILAKELDSAYARWETLDKASGTTSA